MNRSAMPAGTSASTAIISAKQAARAAAIARRDAIPKLDRAHMADCLASVELPFFEPQSIISAYHPIGSEIDILPLVARLVTEGAQTALPVVEGRDRALQFRAWVPGQALERGVLEIPVPPASARQLVPEFLLVPLLAFDRQGYRLGYGAGHYDRTLAHLRSLGTLTATAIGVAFSSQEVPVIPHEHHDQPLDWMITEKGVFKCGSEAQS